MSRLAELSNFSKSYISQVKHGKCQPSQRLLDALAEYGRPTDAEIDYLRPFLLSREAIGVSPSTLRYYRDRLGKFVSSVKYQTASRQDVERHLNSIPPNQNGLGSRHASYRAIRAFYRWLNTQYGLSNPVEGMTAPILGKLILPSFDREQVLYLIEQSPIVRDKAIIALFAESGLRLAELAHVRLEHIDWSTGTLRVLGKGRKEAYAPFGILSRQYLQEWLAEYDPQDGNIWGLNPWGIASMLRRLKEATGLPCNPHTFRRTFACLLRKAGVDTMTIKDLGRWESLEMVQRYTRSVNFQDSMRFYRAPLS